MGKKTQQNRKTELIRMLLNYVMSISEEFPCAGRRIEKVIPYIEKSLTDHFSRRSVWGIEEYLYKLIYDEIEESLTIDELGLLLSVANEYIEIRENDEKSPERGLKLKKSIELELRRLKFVERNKKYAEDAINSFTNFLLFPSEESFSELMNLESSALEQIEEMDEILKSVPEDILYTPERTRVAKKVLASILSQMESSPADLDTKKKETTEALFQRVKRINKIIRKEQQWLKIKMKCEEFFISEMASQDLFELHLGTKSGFAIIII